MQTMTARIKSYIQENPEVMEVADDYIEIQDYANIFASTIELKDVADEDLHDFVEFTIVHTIATGGKTTPSYALHQWVADLFTKEVDKLSA